MGDYDLGTARGRIEIDASTLGRTSAAFSTLGKSMGIIGGIAIGAFAVAVGAAANFEQQLSRFQAVTGANEKQMEALRQKALQLGRDSAYGATEVVQAFVELGKAGATTEEILGGVGDAVVHLAAAGELNMTKAAETMINAMRTFSLGADQAEHVADLLAGAANASTSEVDDLAESLRYAGPIAATAGISIDDLATTLAVFANVGIKGSQAGTVLRGMLAAIAAPSTSAEKAMRQLGLITLDGGNIFFDAAGKIKPMGDVFQILKDHLAGLTKEQQLAILKTIFQRRAMVGAARAAISGKEGFDAMREAMDRVTAKDVMEKKLDNLKGSFKILKASLETFFITIGEGFQGPIKAFADGLRKMTNWLVKLPQPIKEGIGWFLFLFGTLFLSGAAFAFFISKVVKMYRAFKDLQKGFQLLNSAFSAMGIELGAALGPIAVVILAILAIAAVAYVVYKKWDRIWKLISENPALAIVAGIIAAMFAPILLIGFAIGALAANWDAAWAWIQQAASDAWDWIQTAFNDAVNWMQDTWDNIVQAAEDAWNAIQQAFDDAVNWLDQAWTDIKTAVSQAWDAIVKALEDAGNAILTFFENLPSMIADALLALPGLLINFAISAMFAFLNGLVNGVGTVLSWLIQLPPLILQAMIQLPPLLGQLAIDAFLFFFNMANSVFSMILGWMASLPGIIFNALVSLVTFLGNLAIQAFTFFWNTSMSMLSAMLGWWLNLPTTLFNAAVGLISLLGNLGNKAISALWDGLKSLVGAIIGWAGTMGHDIAQAVQAMAGYFFNLGVDAIQGLWNGLKSLASNVVNWAKNLANDIVDAVKSVADIFSPSKKFMWIGQMMMKGLQIGLDDGATGVLGAMTDLATQLTDMPYNLQPAMATSLAPVASTLAPAQGPTTTPTGSYSEGDFVYNNYAREVDPVDIFDEYEWRKLRKVGRRLP